MSTAAVAGFCLVGIVGALVKAVRDSIAVGIRVGSAAAAVAGFCLVGIVGAAIRRICNAVAVNVRRGGWC
jgi:preprotein translocase subunit Sss1